MVLLPIGLQKSFLTVHANKYENFPGYFLTELAGLSGPLRIGLGDISHLDRRAKRGGRPHERISA
jgi:hypothetical protein